MWINIKQKLKLLTSAFITICALYSTNTISAAQLQDSKIQGYVSLGPVNGGIVNVFDFSNGNKGTLLSTSSPTDNKGVYELAVKHASTPILLCSSGGFYEEAASDVVDSNGSKINKVKVDLINKEICAVANYQNGQSQGISITYYTHLAYALTLNKIQNNIAVNTAITQANQEISNWLGVDIIKTQPADITNSKSATGILDNTNKYGFANAGISLLMKGIGGNTFNTANSIILTQKAFDDVAADGQLNGRTGQTQLSIGSAVLSATFYKNDLATNMLDMSATVQNATLIQPTNPDLINFVNTFKAYNQSVFSGSTTINTPPVAVNDVATVTIGASVVIDVTLNDSDADNDPLSIILNSSPANGTTTVSNNSKITYTPNASAIAGTTDSFSYFVYDGKAQSVNSATVSVSIMGVINNPPVAMNDSATVTLGSTQFIPVLANDTDADSNPLIAVVNTQPGSGQSTVSATKGGVNFSAGVVGQETFTYYANDGQANSNLATVTVNVISTSNIAPVANNDTATAIIGGTAVTINVLANDVDADGDALAIASINSTPTLGSAMISGNAIVYTPPKTGGTTTTTFSYVITDGKANSNTATVTVNLTAPLNSVPVAVNDSATAIINGNSVTIPVLNNDFDADGDVIAIASISSMPVVGTATISGNYIIYTPPTSTLATTTSFSYNITDGSLTSKPATVTVTLLP